MKLLKKEPSFSSQDIFFVVTIQLESHEIDKLDEYDKERFRRVDGEFYITFNNFNKTFMWNVGHINLFRQLYPEDFYYDDTGKLIISDNLNLEILMLVS